MDELIPHAVPYSIDAPLEESRRRRPDWTGGVPIELDDGKEWYFPRPLIEIRPDFTGGEPSLTTWGREFDEMLAVEASTLMTVAQKWFRVARFMLLRNYLLKDGDFQILLAFRPADEKNQAAWEMIQAIAYGNPTSPKA